MEPRITEIAERIRALRDIMEIPVAEMAKCCGISENEYIELEGGTKDFSVTFLINCAERFGVDMMELMTGESPHLQRYSVVRAGEGLSVTRRKSFKYEHLAYSFSHKSIEPFYVEAPYSEEEQDKPIHLSTHEGHEMDYILEGTLKVSIGGKMMTLKKGDTLYYDSSTPHGMIAAGGQPCKFLAVVIKDVKNS